MTKNNNNETYDYIIVGGGSAGCVLANRLSAKPNIKVCLIEAGPSDNHPLIRMPMGIIYVIRSNKLNWKYWTTPQKHCADRKIYWPRGRTLGGSSSINAMCYTRGNPNDFDDWANLGNTGWAYKDIFPYFTKFEDYRVGEADAFHAKGGLLTISKPRFVNPLMNVFLQAAAQSGYKTVTDFNGHTREACAGLYDVMQIDGMRCSNATAFLKPILNRPNLNIITNAQVTKILFSNRRASGVIYNIKNDVITVYAQREIILTAGSIGSPQLLLLSGVGPKAELEKHHISVIHDLPGVGENLQDHLDIHITTLAKTHTAYSFHYTAYWRLLKDLCKYIFLSQGELTSNYAQAGGFFKSDENKIAPNMQWHFVPSLFTNSGLNLRGVFSGYGYTLMTCLLQPYSRGTIRLQSSNPYEYPLINPNYLADERDLVMMIEGFKKSRDILQQSPFAPHRLREIEPGTTVKTDNDIADYIRREAQTIYHPVGTCKMGIDDMAVVDPTLKVYGVTGLRVVDASIMPINVRGNTNATVTMIAEKASDMILRD